MNGEVVIISDGLVWTPPGYEDTSVGQFLSRFDADAHGGQGQAWWTPDQDKALRFPSAGEALATWKTQSTVQPLRPDGKPNRPLTAYTVRLESLNPTETTR